MALNPTGEPHRHKLSIEQRLTHGFHGARHRPDVAGAAGFDQDKPQVFEQIGVVRLVHLNGENREGEEF